MYARLGIRFDVYLGESLIKKETMQRAMDILKEKGLLATKTMEESLQNNAKSTKGKPPAQVAEDHDMPDALAIDLEAWKLEKPVLQKGGKLSSPSRPFIHQYRLSTDGTSTYMIRDVAGAMERYEKFKFDKMIYVVGDQQDLHVRQFFKILSLMGVVFADKLFNVNFGVIHGMSTRRGQVEFLDDILDEAKAKMLGQMSKKKMEDIADPDYAADQIGMACVKIQDMQAKRWVCFPCSWSPVG